MKELSSISAMAPFDPAKSAPTCVITLGSWVTLRLAAYSVLLLFLAAGVFGALTQSTGVSAPAPLAYYLGDRKLHRATAGVRPYLFL